MSSARVVAVCIGAGGIPKRVVEQAHVGEFGLVGDGHRHKLHGGSERAVCLLSIEILREFERDRVRPSAAGDFGENLLIEGLEFSELRPGDELEIGPRVRLAISDVREPCVVLQQIDARFPDLMVGRSGWLARVLQGGQIKPDDEVRVRPPPLALFRAC